jgi:hypothetical protein
VISEPADEARTADDLRSVPGWRRTGLVLGWGAVACTGAALLGVLLDRDDPSLGTLIAAGLALIAAFLAPVFLRRAWSVPGVADEPGVVLARRWSDVAIAAWCAAVIFRVVLDGLLDAERVWLVVRAVLGATLVVAYVGMLVLATRWRPAPRSQL